MKHKLLAVFLALVMTLSLLPTAALAEGTGEYSAVPANRLTVYTVGGVTGETTDGAVTFTTSKEDTSDWTQNSGEGSNQAYTYCGVYITMPEGANSLKSTIDAESFSDTDFSAHNSDNAFLQGGAYQAWFPVATEDGNGGFSLFNGGRKYLVLLEWYSGNSCDGVVVVREYLEVFRNLKNPVAKIGTVQFATLEGAIETAQDDDIVELLDNVTINTTQTSKNSGALTIDGKKITIDGGGHTITAGTGFDTDVEWRTMKNGKYHMINIQNGADVTLKNLTVDGNWDQTETDTNAVRTGVNVFTASNAATQSEVTLDNVTIKNCSVYGLVSNGSAVTATKLTTEGNRWGVNLDNQNADLKGTFNMAAGALKEEASLVIENHTDAAGTDAAISGGTFAAVGIKEGHTNCTLSITGGTFSSNPSEDLNASDYLSHYIAPGHVVVFGADGYEVQEAATITTLTPSVVDGTATVEGTTISLDTGVAATIKFTPDQELDSLAYQCGTANPDALTVADETPLEDNLVPTFALSAAEAGTYAFTLTITNNATLEAVFTQEFTINVTTPHEHTYADTWSKDPSGHWHAATCEHITEKADFAAHTFGEWTVTQDPTATEDGSAKRVCSFCSYEETKTLSALGVTTYTITPSVTNGTISPSEAVEVAENGSQRFDFAPNSGYELASVKVDGSDVDATTYYEFTNVTANHTIVVAFTEKTPETEPETMQVDFKVTPTNATIVVKDAQGNAIAANQYGGYDLLPGETYTYTVSASGYVTKTGSFVPSLAAAGGNLVTVDLVRQTSGGGGGGSSSGGSSSSSETTKNPDGSTTTTTTDKTTGTVTEVTKEKDGTTTTVETKKDGTVTETVKTPEGVTGTVVTDKNGDVTEAKATVSTAAAKEAAKTGEAVTLPVEVPAVKTTEEAPALQVTVPKSADSVKVEIPVEKVTPGTVAVIVNADGTEKIVSTSAVTENGVALTLDGNATVKIIDNSKSFTDVPANSVFYNEISSLSAREIMVGKTDDKFDLHSSVTLDQIANVAGRITGAVDVKDFGAGVAWGAESGLKTGNEAATRGDVLKALYIAAGSPAVEDTSVLNRFNDAASIPADMATIAAWAAQNGILKGDLSGNANLGVNVTRGQACALAGRTMGTLA